MSSDRRAVVRQLAADLTWLEEHCRRQPALAFHAAHLRLAAALARNVVGPAVDGVAAKPLFVAVVGGAGAGKSTVVNLLCGGVVAEANPQAGYTRHPTAYLPAGGTDWPSTLGFLGPLQRLSAPQPGNLDEDVYQTRRRPVLEHDPLDEFVVWDCPDMTTWAATGYVSRLVEVTALADVVAYVASDERYNDAVPTEFLHLLVRAGKAVVCCLTKMRQADADALVSHFRKEVLGQLPAAAGGDIPPIPCVPIPHLPADVRSDPTGKAAEYRVALVNQLLVLCPSAEAARKRTVANAVAYLEHAGDGLLDVARQDLAELDTWRGLVAAGKKQFEDRYRQEFLSGEAFRRFDRTREQVLHMLDLPGAGKLLSVTLGLVRAPYTYGKPLVTNLLTRPPGPSQSERAVSQAALAGWLDMLQAETLRRSGTHPQWKQLAHAFDGGLKLQATDRFEQVFRSFELMETDELDAAAKAVPEKLANSPPLLVTLRVLVVLLDLAAVGLVLWATWVPSWYHLLLIPLATSANRMVVEWLVWLAVEAGRSRVRTHREALVQEGLTGPLAEWLNGVPASSGTTLQSLQDVLRRIPDAIRTLAAAVRPPEPTP